jgi:type IV secretory pathway VirB6-like protein
VLLPAGINKKTILYICRIVSSILWNRAKLSIFNVNHNSILSFAAIIQTYKSGGWLHDREVYPADAEKYQACRLFVIFVLQLALPFRE